MKGGKHLIKAWHKLAVTPLRPIDKGKKVLAPAGYMLIELLFVITLVSIVGLGIYSMFDSGIRVVERVTSTVREEDLNIFFEKFSRDLQNSFPYIGIPFEGVKDKLAFATTIQTVPELGFNQGIGRVRYFYDRSERAIHRAQEHMSQVFEEEESKSTPVLNGVFSLNFKYYEYVPGENAYKWTEERKSTEEKTSVVKGKIPVAVKIQLEFDDEGKKRSVTRTIAAPVGG